MRTFLGNVEWSTLTFTEYTHSCTLEKIEFIVFVFSVIVHSIAFQNDVTVNIQLQCVCFHSKIYVLGCG
jgi:hypothetical protein